ncbi:hypothetical protein [Streptomyces sp. NBC_00268]|uniref:hypothetical protein n=1 Tax=Streptomyces sp. NBC_00268 TaxID=2975695 RepID=UPI00225B5893|nr:hypothetical protein [Streptomyces sp. NBC_00268]MCX5182667.1 ATP-binding protein [Streptomyces sp. NBC_00268]
MPGTTTPQRERRSRKPTGRPNPPIVLLTGPDKTGKGHEAAVGSGSDLIAMTYWLQVGGSSSTADYYGRIEGARYEIVPHDGSFWDVLDAIRWAISQAPAQDGTRNMVVIDDISSVWDLLSDEVSQMSRKRAERRAQANGQRPPRLDDPYVDEDRDLWTYAKDRWGEMLWLLRRHNGPTLLIARQEIITAFENDKPTQHTTRRIKAEKNIKASVDAVVEFHALGEAYVTGMHTVPSHWKIRPGWTYRYEGVDDLLRRLGYEEAAETRAVIEPRPEAYLGEQLPVAEQPQRGLEQNTSRPGRPDSGLNSSQAVEIIAAALKNSEDPKAALLGVRAEWGTRTLQQVTTRTSLGVMSADDLITRSIEQVETAVNQKTGGEQRQDETRSDAQPDQVPRDQAREHTEAPSQPQNPIPAQPDQAPADDNAAPPPPDPEAEEPPPIESPEETSAAEEPQDLPATRPATTPPRQPRKKTIALDALDAEADVQARLKMVTKGEHLGPISEEGEPSMTVLRNYLVAQRPGLIAQLEREGHAELAALYRSAPEVDTQIRRKFAAYFESVPAEQ